MRRHLVVFIIFIILTAALTFPLMARLGEVIPGFYSTDEPFAALWDSWRIRVSARNHLSLRHTDLIAYPYGVDLFRWGGGLLIGTVWNHLLSYLLSQVLAWNVQIILNFILCGFFVYLLVYYLTGDQHAGILSGVIFAFCPYQFARSWQHLGLTYNQWIPLLLLSAFFYREHPGRKGAVFVIAVGILLASFDYSVTYMGTVSGIAFLIYVFFYQWKTKIKRRELLHSDLRYLRKMFVVIGIAGIILLPQVFPLIKNRLTLSASTEASAFNAFHRPFEDLFAQSARPLSYFLPSVHHPVFGSLTSGFVGSSLYGESLTEHTLYLGWTGLILSFFAFRMWRRRQKVQEDPRWFFYAGFFLFLGLVAWLFSQPPWWQIGGMRITFPSRIMYKLLPMFRAYCRFGIVLMLSIAVLAGLQWHRIVRRIGSPLMRSIMTAAVCALILFEFWNWPPYKVIDVSRVPQAYSWLKAQPDDTVIAEYPLDEQAPNEMFKFYQTYHGKKIVNGALPGTPAYEFVAGLSRLSDRETVEKLKERGVTYLVVHNSLYNMTDRVSDKQELGDLFANPLLELVAAFPAERCLRQDVLCTLEAEPIQIYKIRGEED